MAVKTLQTRSEVLSNSGIVGNLSTCKIHDVDIIEAENDLFTNCFGIDFYKELKDKDHLADYSAVDEHVQNQSYNAGDKVIFKGIIYKAKATTTNEPTYSTDWEVAPKFTTSKFNDLWCNGLSKILALKVMHNTIPILSMEMRENGVVKATGGDFEHASSREIQSVLDHFKSRIESLRSVVDTWIKANNDDNTFDKYKPIKEKITSDCSEDEDCKDIEDVWVA